MSLTQINKILYIVSSPSGAGKSTLCRHTAAEHAKKGEHAVILSTDATITSPFYKEDKVEDLYTWSPDGTVPSHRLNQIKCRLCMEKKIPVIIIDNTNLRFSEIKPYILHAIKYDYKIEFTVPDTPWITNISELYERNLHAVPLETIKKQVNDFLRIDYGVWSKETYALKQEYKKYGKFVCEMKCSCGASTDPGSCGHHPDCEMKVLEG